MSSETVDYGVDITDPVVNAETRAPMLIVVLCVGAFLTLLFVSLRIYTRAFILRQFGADDTTIVIAVVFCLATIFVTGMEVRYGLGKHTWVVPHDDYLIQQRYLYAVMFVYNMTTNVLKGSFLLQYRRLLAGSTMLKICNFALVFIILWTITQLTITGTSCSPLTTIVPSMKGHCLPQDSTWNLSSAMNIITDFLILCIPLPVISRLRMASKKQKIILISLFCLGFFTCILSIMRVVTLTGRIGNKDSGYNAVIPVIWGIAEMTCGIMTSCFITLRPFARRYLPGFSEPSHNKNDPNSNDFNKHGYELNQQRMPNSLPHISANDMRKRPETSTSIEGLTSTDIAYFSGRGDTIYMGEHGGESSDEGPYLGKETGRKIKKGNSIDYAHMHFETMPKGMGSRKIPK